MVNCNSCINVVRVHFFFTILIFARKRPNNPFNGMTKFVRIMFYISTFLIFLISALVSYALYIQVNL